MERVLLTTWQLQQTWFYGLFLHSIADLALPVVFIYHGQHNATHAFVTRHRVIFFSCLELIIIISFKYIYYISYLQGYSYDGRIHQGKHAPPYRSCSIRVTPVV